MGIGVGERVMTLATLNDGAAVEMFDMELLKILDNIADVNTDPEQKREITLRVVLHPDIDRRQAVVDIECKSKMAAHRGSETTVYLGKIEGVRVAVESGLNQGSLWDKPGPEAGKQPAGKESVKNGD